MGIYSVKIQNFKSIRETNEILIKPINVLIGANGAGKSNFISFFKLLNKLYEQQLQLHINRNGRAESFLYFGIKRSEFLAGKIVFDDESRNEYSFKMVPDQSGSLIFSEEYNAYQSPEGELSRTLISAGGNLESNLTNNASQISEQLSAQFNAFRVFHFHDTGFNSKIKQPCETTDYACLHEDGSNLASFLYRLQQANPQHFKIITKVIQSVAPFFQEFYLVPDEINPQQIFLRWKEKGSDKLFSAHNLSDGTLRMIGLSTLLLQPQLPSTIIIDEPELGLHPFAIQKLAAMIKSAASKSQLIISTQSINLVDQFTADDIIVVERGDNQTLFNRLNEASLANWREEYALGELWSKNVLGGTS